MSRVVFMPTDILAFQWKSTNLSIVQLSSRFTKAHTRQLYTFCCRQCGSQQLHLRWSIVFHGIGMMQYVTFSTGTIQCVLILVRSLKHNSMGLIYSLAWGTIKIRASSLMMLKVFLLIAYERCHGTLSAAPICDGVYFIGDKKEPRVAVIAVTSVALL